MKRLKKKLSKGGFLVFMEGPDGVKASTVMFAPGKGRLPWTDKWRERFESGDYANRTRGRNTLFLRATGVPFESIVIEASHEPFHDIRVIRIETLTGEVVYQEAEFVDHSCRTPEPPQQEKAVKANRKRANA